MEREHRINVRATPEEAEMLRQLAELSGLSQSDYLRQAIRRSHAEAFGAKVTKAKKAKPRL